MGKTERGADPSEPPFSPSPPLARKRHVILRPARPEDVEDLANVVAMADPQFVAFLASLSDPPAARRALEAFILADEPTRYAVENALVADMDGQTVGASYAFPADRQIELDRQIVAWINSCGMSFPRLMQEGAAETYYLLSMAVYEPFRSGGIGRMLMGGAMARGKAMGFSRASLLVDEEKDTLAAFYGRMGFKDADHVMIGPMRYRRMEADLTGDRPDRNMC